MTKFELEVLAFTTAFNGIKDKKIVLYGTGRMTATLVELQKGFNIVGLCDRDPNLVGTYMYGLPILSQEQAEKLSDFVVINTAEIYWNTIYSRIKEWKVPIYFRNGQQAQEINTTNIDDPYWNCSFSDLKKKIENKEVVSFDIFDTLLLRKVFYQIDVFRLIEKRIRTELNLDIDFIELRKKAIANLNEPTLDEIYFEIGKNSSVSTDLLNRIKEMEIETELEIVVPRIDILKLYKKISRKKEVFLISDMYYSKSVMQRILRKIGVIIDSDHILVSCELKKTKADGSLWKYYKDSCLKGKSAIHIGDNIKSDCFIPREYEIDSFYIMNVNDMLEKSSIGNISSKINSLYASICIGIISSKIFNSPFALNKTKGKIDFINNRLFGEFLFGPVVYSFMLWLLIEARKLKIDTLLFFGREGYLLIRAYKKLRKLLVLNNLHFPEAKYLEISRRAVMNASVESNEDFEEILRFPYSGTIHDYLKSRFNIKVNNYSTDLEERMTFVREKKDLIMKVIKKERIGYLKYLSKVLSKCGHFGIIDSWYYGNNQYYLGKTLKSRIYGFYFDALLSNDNVCYQNQNMLACFHGEGKNSNLYRKCLFGEAFFTSPKGMLLYVDKFGKKHYAKRKKNQKKFKIRNVMQKGIYDFLFEIIKLQLLLNFDNLENDRFFSDELFGVFMDDGFIVPEKIKDSFWYDNGMMNNKEEPIWS